MDSTRLLARDPARRPRPLRGALLAAAVASTTAVLLAGCGADGVDPTETSTTGATASGAGTAVDRAEELPSPEAQALEGSPLTEGSPPADGPPADGPTNLVIEVDDGSGAIEEYTLSCDPPAGSHPDPTAACGAVAAALQAPDDPFEPTPPGTMCTQEFGGPETAAVTGTVGGEPVAATLSLRDGCEIDRWVRLGPLLSPFATAAPGGVTG